MCVQVNGDAYLSDVSLTPLSRVSLVIKAGALTPGGVYVFRLTGMLGMHFLAFVDACLFPVILFRN